MISLKNPNQIAKMREAGKILREVEDEVAVGEEEELDLLEAQGLLGEGLAAFGALALGAFEKEFSRRDIGEQVLHGHRGAVRGASGNQGPADAVVHRDGASVGIDGQARAGCDAGEGLAAETEGPEAEEVLQGADLAGCVAGAGEKEVVLAHAAAVVGHGEPGDASFLEIYADFLRAGID